MNAWFVSYLGGSLCLLLIILSLSFGNRERPNAWDELLDLLLLLWLFDHDFDDD